jgi:hypothetical protein
MESTFHTKHGFAITISKFEMVEEKWTLKTKWRECKEKFNYSSITRPGFETLQNCSVVQSNVFIAHRSICYFIHLLTDYLMTSAAHVTQGHMIIWLN